MAQRSCHKLKLKLDQQGPIIFSQHGMLIICLRLPLFHYCFNILLIFIFRMMTLSLTYTFFLKNKFELRWHLIQLAICWTFRPSCKCWCIYSAGTFYQMTILYLHSCWNHVPCRCSNFPEHTFTIFREQWFQETIKS